MSSYCFTHDREFPLSSQCPVCRAEEAAQQREKMIELQEDIRREAQERYEEATAREEDRQEELRELLEQESYKRQNPGEYECPGCRYKTLRFQADRCPMCRSQVPDDYWSAVHEREMRAFQVAENRRKRKEEEWARGEPERQRLASEAEEKARLTRLSDRRARWRGEFLWVYFAYALPGISLTSFATLTGVFHGVKLHAVLAPLVNWYAWFMVYVDPAEVGWPLGEPRHDLMRLVIGVWAAVGIVVAAVVPAIFSEPSGATPVVKSAWASPSKRKSRGVSGGLLAFLMLAGAAATGWALSVKPRDPSMTVGSESAVGSRTGPSAGPSDERRGAVAKNKVRGQDSCTPSASLNSLIAKPTDDTYVGTVYKMDGAPGEGTLGFGGWGDQYDAYLRFDVTSLPPADNVTSATLCLFAIGLPARDPGLRIGRITQPWSGSSLSLKSRPPSAVAGAMAPVSAGWNAIDVTSTYREWKQDPSSAFGFSISPTNTVQSNGAFASRENPDSAKTPRLVVRVRDVAQSDPRASRPGAPGDDHSVQNLATLPTPPSVVEPAQAAVGTREGGGPPTKTRHVDPIYPRIAIAARIEGTVTIDATIGVTGEVKGAIIVHGQALLNDAALNAVRQWTYEPTLRDGTAVEVVARVTVTFSLR